MLYYFIYIIRVDVQKLDALDFTLPEQSECT